MFSSVVLFCLYFETRFVLWFVGTRIDLRILFLTFLGAELIGYSYVLHCFMSFLNFKV